MQSLTQIQHDKFYIDCGDNATLRECVKLLPYNKNWVQFASPMPSGICDTNSTIAIETNNSYYTIDKPHAEKPIIYQYNDIAEFVHLWHKNVHIMD